MRNQVIIIAEAGVNHNGDLAMAKKLIDVASSAGVDFVKFQTFKADKLVSKEAKLANYQSLNIDQANLSQYEMLRNLEMPDYWHYELMAYAKEKDVSFLSTAFDEDSIDFLNQLGVSHFKIPSGEITNLPYLLHIASKGKPVILSTGMSELQEIRNAVDLLTENGIKREDLIILHCNTEYPTPMEDVNLLAMNSIGKALDVKVGYSDHTSGIEVPIAAVALGAVLIEKHFTLDKTLPGPDHKASLNPDELVAMVKAIKNIELAISGDGEKSISNSEAKNLIVARKSIHLKCDKKVGEYISIDDLEMVRPGDGISPMRLYDVVGMRVVEDLFKGHKLLFKNISN